MYQPNGPQSDETPAPTNTPVVISRRALLAAGASAAIAACSSGTASNAEAPGSSRAGDSTSFLQPTGSTRPETVEAPPFSGSDPFQLGVASGDPDSTSLILWTRLLPDDRPDGFDDTDYTVAWDVSTTDDFENLVAAGTVIALGRHAHSVHLDVGDLEPDSWYWYRFRLGDHESPIGRCRTTPGPGDFVELRFGFASCQHWELGAYAAHRHAAELDDMDLFIWLGDYIYENGANERGVETEASGLRVHNSDEVFDLDEYRARYALYRSDPHLQANHAARPWVVTWDDHEVDNNYAGSLSSNDQDADEFAARRRAAHQAWWEHMPVRLDPPDGELISIHRTIRWGSLLDLHMLDGRQYRDPAPTDGEPVPVPGYGDIGVQTLGPTALDPDHSMLGADQEAWLLDQIAGSSATWTVLGNQVYMHGLTGLPGEPAINTDTWDGYFGNRARLLSDIDDVLDGELVVLSGDFHASTVAALRTDPFDTSLDPVGTELMAPAISSPFPEDLRDVAPLAVAINPHVFDFSSANGYMLCTVDEDGWIAERMNVERYWDEDSSVDPTARYSIRPGAPGAVLVT